MVLASLLGAAPAEAAGPRGESAKRAKRAPEVVKAVRPSLSPETLDKLRALLAGTDPAAALAATKALSDSAAVNAPVPLIEVLSVGAAPPVAMAAIDALKKLADPSGLEVLVLYAGHRDPDLRRHAVEALGALSDAHVVSTLVDRLGDSAPDVRAAAAEALAARGERSAAPRMLGLLKRNDSGATAPLGAIAPVSMVPTIAELQGSVDDANLATTLGELLKRPDMPEPVRIDIVKTLARVPGAASTTALAEYIGSVAAHDTRPSKTEAQKVLDDRGKQP
jgi:HEAT repeat protein